jgi:DNA-binding XRE family transcriptional regulator
LPAIEAHTDRATSGSVKKHDMGNERIFPDLLPSMHGPTPQIRGRNAMPAVPQFPGMAKKLKKATSRICLASNLRAARSLFQWSQEELGLQCGLKRTYIGALERREVNPGIDNLDKLALGVGVLAHVLLLSPELAYAEIYGAFSLGPAH